jgi:hypothetical protein
MKQAKIAKLIRLKPDLLDKILEKCKKENRSFNNFVETSLKKSSFYK